MQNLAKSIMTTVIWLLVGGIAITALVVGEGVYEVGDVLIPSFVATLLATFIIWGIPELAASSQEQSATDMVKLEKNKRGVSSDDRMAMLMALMTEEEREDFKAMLKRRVLAEANLSDDGEFLTDGASLDSLLYHNEQKNY